MGSLDFGSGKTLLGSASWTEFSGEFSKIFLGKLLECIIFAYFSKKIIKPGVNFSQRLDEKHKFFEIFEKFLKIFDENSIEKLNFLLFLENLLLKIEPSEISSFFYNSFFSFRGISPFSPWLRPWMGF